MHTHTHTQPVVQPAINHTPNTTLSLSAVYRYRHSNTNQPVAAEVGVCVSLPSTICVCACVCVRKGGRERERQHDASWVGNRWNVSPSVSEVGLSTDILNLNIYSNIKKNGDSIVKINIRLWEKNTSAAALRVGAWHDGSGTGHRSRTCTASLTAESKMQQKPWQMQIAERKT